MIDHRSLIPHQPVSRGQRQLIMGFLTRNTSSEQEKATVPFAQNNLDEFTVLIVEEILRISFCFVNLKHIVGWGACSKVNRLIKIKYVLGGKLISNWLMLKEILRGYDVCNTVQPTK